MANLQALCRDLIDLATTYECQSCKALTECHIYVCWVSNLFVVVEHFLCHAKSLVRNADATSRRTSSNGVFFSRHQSKCTSLHYAALRFKVLNQAHYYFLLAHNVENDVGATDSWRVWCLEISRRCRSLD